MVYGNAHRSLLRTIASQGVISFENCMNIFKGLPDKAATSLETVIHEINKEIEPFEQEIKIVIDELTTERKVVFLSLGYDDATMSQNVFSPKELDYFRLLIENIMSTENREIEIHAALNLAGKVKPVLKKTDAEIILKTWCSIHYLDKNENCYALGIRAIHEFENYLQKNMPETIRNCSICGKNVFRGVNCPACYSSIHTRCLNLSLEKVKKWPCCEVDFSSNGMDNGPGTSTMLTQTQLIPNSSNESMDVSEVNVTVDADVIAPRRKKKRLILYELTQTQLIPNSSNESMDVSEVNVTVDADVIAPRRKKKRLILYE